MQRTDSAKNARRDKITALVALAILAVLASYHLWDIRGAFEDFDGWWVYFEPVFPGDDYARVTEFAERRANWHDRYRAITLGVAIRRATPDVEVVYAPDGLWHLWGARPYSPTSWDAPGIKGDYFATTIARAERTTAEYDPALAQSTIDTWESAGAIERLNWNVAYVTGAEDDRAVVLHRDADFSVVYVVPLSLSPAREEIE